MEILKVYLVNISILITFAYIINIAYNFVFMRLSKSVRYGVSVIIFILAGWLTMFFSFEVGHDSKFDLRVIPLIFGLTVYSNPVTLFLIGLSIGILRLTFGLDTSAWVGFFNLTLLGIISSLICVWFNRRQMITYFNKAVIAVLAINGFNLVNISLFGIISFHQYLFDVAPITFPTGVVLSFFFLFMIRDFQQNQSRMEELSRANRLLRMRTQDLNQAKTELENKAEQLESASQYKSEFLANMSHELKTPLNSVLLLSEMQMEQETKEEDRVRYSKMIHQSGGELLSLVNDILDLSKVEAGKLDIVEQPIALNDVLRLMEEQFRPLAESRGLDFETKLSGVEMEWITTDPMRLNQILRNLLGNAFKFTQKGKVELEISTMFAPEARGEAIFQVRDTGVGIESDKQEVIFEGFKQEDGSISRKYGGSGLGLTISRQLAELLGGKLELHSEKGKGSCFTLRLPIL